jgi:hypothetical protein
MWFIQWDEWSFAERIEVDEPEMKIIYTIPIPPDNPPAETVGVLPFVHNGSLLETDSEPFARLAMRAKGELSSIFTILASSI